MSNHPLGEPKWPLPDVTSLSTLMKGEVWSTIERNLVALGKPWRDVVSDQSLELLSAADTAAIDERVFRTFSETEGRPFLAATQTSLAEWPDRYIHRSTFLAAQEAAQDLSGLPAGVLGVGDNVFEASDIEGTALVVRRVADVQKLLEEGVPDGSIAIIDDAGGTLTAPILPEFTAVICKGGTVRSHLGIISREFGVPCLMGAVFAKEPATGDRLVVRYSDPATDPDSYYGGPVGYRTRIEATT